MPITISNSISNENVDNYLDIWKKLWSVRDTAWHLENRHPVLVKYDHLLTNNENNSNKKRFLFPLCGKNVDMKWYWETGHKVIGVECADEAIDDFFSVNKISHKSYLSSELEKCKIFETNDKNLKILQTNFLTLDSPQLKHTIDAVWDRGSFGTITYEEQVLYANTMRHLLAPDFHYLLLVLEFDDNLFKGPPFSISEERVNHLYGSFCNIDKLESTVPQHVQLYQNHMKQSIQVQETVYLLTKKQ
ncbi:thiopurine S-methyltransferase-like [Oppia nitens]|uniref:thiopurine S-methyltransferase-like n=1 Tax=Oppia nitens TaxID=1686743 RepID=UPI0023DABB0D|nr:thiopurine S-methyltransferase-like [Oppia nitens]